MGSGGNAAGSGATPAGTVACTCGPQFIEGKPTGAQGRPRPEHRKRRASTARSASRNCYREQRTVAGNCTGCQPGSRVRANGKFLWALSRRRHFYAAEMPAYQALSADDFR